MTALSIEHWYFYQPSQKFIILSEHYCIEAIILPQCARSKKLPLRKVSCPISQLCHPLDPNDLSIALFVGGSEVSTPERVQDFLRDHPRQPSSRLISSVHH